MSPLVTAQQERLNHFRSATAEIRERTWADLLRAADPLIERPWRQRGEPPPISGGAPQLQQTLAVSYAASTVNTITGPTSLLEADARGPFSQDPFYRPGACFQQEALGILGSTATPTIVFGTYMGNVSGTITTALCVNAAITTASGVANADWYYNVFGRVVASNAASSTIICSGWVVNNINALATVVQTAVKNATPPTAVTVDLSGGGVFVDLKGTWSASSASNTTTVNFYGIQSVYI